MMFEIELGRTLARGFDKLRCDLPIATKALAEKVYLIHVQRSFVLGRSEDLMTFRLCLADLTLQTIMVVESR